MSNSRTRKNRDREEEALLDARTASYKADAPQGQLLLCGVVASFLPTYVAYAYFDVSWTNIFNFPLFLLVSAATSWMLQNAYGVMFSTEFLKRQRHYGETKTDADAKLLLALRGQVALSYTLFLVNALFVGMCSVLQLYLLRQLESRVSYVVCPLAAAGVVWFIALKNEGARQRKRSRN